MRTIILSALMALATNAFAQTEHFFPDKAIARSSMTVVIVTASTGSFTLTDTPQMEGSDRVVIQSTYAAAGFCCSAEAAATSGTTAGARGCIRAKQEPGGGFYELEVRRWWQNLRLYCKGLDLLQNGITLNVLQQK